MEQTIADSQPLGQKIEIPISNIHRKVNNLLIKFKAYKMSSKFEEKG